MAVRPSGDRRGVDRLRGFFITFEGGEGAGKSTQIKHLAAALERDGHSILVTREPGGSPGAEATRHVLLSGGAEKYGAEMEALLFAAARNDHVVQVIRPAVSQGKIVLCDRFMDSSRVYQGISGNLDPQLMINLERIAIDGMTPDLTLVLDIDPELGLGRAAIRGAADRYEKEGLELHRQRRQAFLAIAAKEPERCIVIDASKSETEIATAILSATHSRLKALRP